MRTIKFRAKMLNRNKNVFGSLYCAPDGKTYIITETGRRTQVNPETVSQLVCTTKDGVEIYEGDLLYDSTNDDYCTVFYDEDSYGFSLEYDIWIENRPEYINELDVL